MLEYWKNGILEDLEECAEGIPLEECCAIVTPSDE